MSNTVSISVMGLMLVAVVLVANAAGSGGQTSDGQWLDGSRSSCRLICQVAGLRAWNTYRFQNDDYVVCRVKPSYPVPDYAGRPGFQHQAGSPNVCKVFGVDRGPSLVSDEVLSSYDCLCR